MNATLLKRLQTLEAAAYGDDRTYMFFQDCEFVDGVACPVGDPHDGTGKTYSKEALARLKNVIVLYTDVPPDELEYNPGNGWCPKGWNEHRKQFNSMGAKT